MRFLFGTFLHTIDAKGRVSIPQRFREILADGHDRTRLMILEGFEGCLFCYAASEFETILARLHRQSFEKKEVRELLRWLSAKGSVVEVDGQGRVPLTEEQRRAGDLKKEALLVGAASRIEIWNPSAFVSRPTKSDGAALAEGLFHELTGGLGDGDGAERSAAPRDRER